MNTPPEWHRRTWVRVHIPNAMAVEEFVVKLQEMGLDITMADVSPRRFHANTSVLIAIPREVIADMMNSFLAQLNCEQVPEFKFKSSAAAANFHQKKADQSSWPPAGCHTYRAPQEA